MVVFSSLGIVLQPIRWSLDWLCLGCLSRILSLQNLKESDANGLRSCAAQRAC
ncbi:unnamed protein product, partial [Vitis vinifera]|uniref:Uncharacterized protein n=1 Tax=Vitis vinifera TaxID=29760 RepID=D7TUT5_VITVI